MSMASGASELAQALAASFGGVPLPPSGPMWPALLGGAVYVSVSVLLTEGCLLASDCLAAAGGGSSGCGGGCSLYLTTQERSAAGFVAQQGKVLAAASLGRTALTDVKRALRAARGPVSVAVAPIPAAEPTCSHGLDFRWPFASESGLMGAVLVAFPSSRKLSAGTISRLTEVAQSLAAPLAVRAKAVTEDLWAAGALPLPLQEPLDREEGAEGEGEGDAAAGSPRADEEGEGDTAQGSPRGGGAAGSDNPAQRESSWKVLPAASGSGAGAETLDGPGVGQRALSDDSGSRKQAKGAAGDGAAEYGAAGGASKKAAGAGASANLDIKQDPLLLSFKDPLVEEGYAAWSNAGRMRTDFACTLVALVLYACIGAVTRFASPTLRLLLLCQLAQLCMIAVARGAYLRHRELVCALSALLQVWQCCAVLNSPLMQSLSAQATSSVYLLTRLTAAEPMAVLALAYRVRLAWHLPTHLAALAIILAQLPATYGRLSPGLALGPCGLLVGSLATTVGFIAPTLAVFHLERRCRRRYLKQAESSMAAAAAQQ